MPIFDVLVCFIPEQIAAIKVKKNPGKPGNFWLETACSYRVENRDEFEKLSKIVDVFIKNWMTTP